MRVKLIIEYLGTNYCGWQTQRDGNSVQAEIERALMTVTGEKTEVEASGRTDKGVHAKGQVAHFDTQCSIPPDNFYKALNQKLPLDIRIKSSEQVSNDFHARFNTKRKTYCYNFYVSEVARPILASTHAHIKPPFDFKLAHKCICEFEGEHDFKGFMSVGSNKENTVRTIYSCKLTYDKTDDTYALRVCGNGFLYNMVRIIAGTVVAVGAGRISSGEIPAIIASRERAQAGSTAPACGLVLEEVRY